MITSAEIKKGKGIEELLAGYGEQAEIERVIQIEEPSALQYAMRVYELKLEKGHKIIPTDEIYENPLTPAEIAAFLQATVSHEKHRDYCQVTGYIVSALIRASYSAGHNSFILDTTHLKEIDYLCFDIKGEAGRPIRVDIKGDVGDNCGAWAKKAIIRVTGNTGELCGQTAQDSEFTITGRTGYSCGGDAKNSVFNIHEADSYCGTRSKSSTFNIQASVKNCCGDLAQDSIFNIEGDVGEDCGHMSCSSTFRTHNRQTLEKLKKMIKYGNRIVLIDRNGVERIVRDYDKR